MSLSQNRSKLFIKLLSILFVIIVNFTYVNANNLLIEKGDLNLTNYNFEDSGNIELEGEWCYYNKKFLNYLDIKKNNNFGFVKVPKNLNGQICGNDTLSHLGYGTYYTKVIINKNDIGKIFLFRVKGIYTASKIFVNGKLVGYGGGLSKNKISAIPELQIHLKEFIADSDTLNIVIQSSNYYILKSGIFYKLELGLASTIRESNLLSIGRSLFIIGAIIIMMLYHLALYFLRRKEKLTLYFALLCLAIAIYSLCYTELYYYVFSDFGFQFQLRLRRISLYLSLLFFILFIYHSFKYEFNKKVLKVAVIVNLFFILITIVLPLRINAHFLVHFYYVGILSIAYTIFVIFKALRNNREGAKVLIAGMIAIILSMVNDILFTLQIINSIDLIPYAFFFTTFTQAVLISIRFSKAFSRNEVLLIEKNILRRENKEKNALIQEIHHRVKNNLQSISSIIDMQTRSLKNKKEKNILTEVQTRITSMSLVHEMLYSTDDLSQIPVKSYIKTLIKTIDKMVNTEQIPIKFTQDINPIFLNLNNCISLGMLTNEVIANSIKYAFKQSKSPEILINLHYNQHLNKLTYTIKDNGIGISEDIVNKERASFGMHLIDIFARQLEADLEIRNNKGTEVKIIFKLNNEQE